MPDAPLLRRHQNETHCLRKVPCVLIPAVGANLVFALLLATFITGRSQGSPLQVYSSRTHAIENCRSSTLTKYYNAPLRCIQATALVGGAHPTAAGTAGTRRGIARRKQI